MVSNTLIIGINWEEDKLDNYLVKIDEDFVIGKYNQIEILFTNKFDHHTGS